MQRARYTAEFSLEAVKQVVECGRSAVNVSKRLGVSKSVLYGRMSKSRSAGGPAEPQAQDMKAMQAEMNRLRAELRRTTEERDILKKATAYFAEQSG
jgi:transposase